MLKQTFKTGMTKHIFPSAVEALEAAAAFDAGTEEFYQYKVNAEFQGPDLTLAGYEVRIYDLNGFAIRDGAYLSPS